MKNKFVSPFETVSFKEVCSLLESDRYFIMIFKGNDDLMDTYQSILLDNPDLARGFCFPNGYNALLIEKNENSKNLLVDYILELGYTNIGNDYIKR